MKKILFCGSFAPKSIYEEIDQISIAGCKFQHNLIENLRKHYKVNTISYVAIPLTKKQKNQIQRESTENALYICKDRTIIKSLCKFRKKILKKIEEYDYIFYYNVEYPWFYIPNKIDQNKNFLILADFSDTCSSNNIIKKLYSKIIKNNFKYYKYILALNSNLSSYFNSNQIFSYIPGAINNSKIFRQINNIHAQPVLMYSGLLSKVTGVDMLIDAMDYIDYDFRLIIPGSGPLKEYIINKSERDNRIIYLGILPENEYYQKLCDANILVNPRNMNLPENINNFPSKIFEYLASGKIIVSTKFNNYHIFPDSIVFCDSNPCSIAEGINHCISDYSNLSKKSLKQNIAFVELYSWDNIAFKINGMLNIKQ